MRKGGYLMINGYACKVVNMSTAKTGKHGGAKVGYFLFRLPARMAMGPVARAAMVWVTLGTRWMFAPSMRSLCV